MGSLSLKCVGPCGGDPTYRAKDTGWPCPACRGSGLITFEPSLLEQWLSVSHLAKRDKRKRMMMAKPLRSKSPRRARIAWKVLERESRAKAAALEAERLKFFAERPKDWIDQLDQLKKGKTCAQPRKK